MNAAKLVLNALVIGVLNLTSFLVGFFLFRISATDEQRLVQGTAAIVVSVVLVVFWLVAFRKINRLEVEYDFIKVFFLVFPCTPLIFVPVHFLITGYLTGVGNLVAVAAYQFPMNLLALVVGAALIRRQQGLHGEGLPQEGGTGRG